MIGGRYPFEVDAFMHDKRSWLEQANHLRALSKHIAEGVCLLRILLKNLAAERLEHDEGFCNANGFESTLFFRHCFSLSVL